ncbi:MAG: hypothetical protein ACYC1Q_07125 [Bacteroidia bacterium]
MSSQYSNLLDFITREFSPYTFGLLLILILTFHYRRSVSAEFRRLFPLLVYWPLSEFAGIACRLAIGSNTPVHHLYTVLYYLLVVYYFYPLLRAEKGMKFYFIASSILLSLFTVLNAILFQPLMVVMPTNAIMFHCLFILTITLFSFKQMLANPIPMLLRYQSQFWISAGLLVFNSWAFFFFATHAYFLQIGNYPLLFLKIPGIIAFVMLLLFLMAFWAEIKTNQFRHERIAK